MLYIRMLYYFLHLIFEYIAGSLLLKYNFICNPYISGYLFTKSIIFHIYVALYF
jgi:hypothetical protein